MLPSKGIWIGFGGLFAVVLGFALITAPGMVLFLRLINPILQRILGIYGRMAPRNLINTLSRTSVAVAALMISVSVSIGVTLMIDSFRYTVSQWLQQSLSGDIYITSQNFISTLPAAPIDPAVVEQIKANSKVSRVDVLKNGQVPSPTGVIQVSATDNYSLAEERVFKFLWVSRDDVWQELQNGAVIITEPLSIKMGLEKPGQSIILTTSTGDKAFPVVGVYHDYSSSSGSVQMDISLYRKYWNDPDISAMGVRLKSPVEIEKTISEFYETLQTNQLLYIRANSTLRDEVMTVFDRTFAITRALQILATLVAFVGILSALSLLQYEKQREVGIIRALGFTSSQLWRLMMLETGLMGLIAGFFAMPTGYTLALILIEVINQRSFGWSINLYLTWQPFIQALAVSLTASLLAGILPSRKISKMQTIEAIRYE
jgi:putative ABC transport system permease protein